MILDGTSVGPNAQTMPERLLLVETTVSSAPQLDGYDFQVGHLGKCKRHLMRVEQIEQLREKYDSEQ